MLRFVLVGAALLLVGCGGGRSGRVVIPVDSSDTRSKHLANLVRSAPDLERFDRAMATTALSQTLQDLGPYTVFAPNNGAFRNSALSIDTLMTAANRDSLRKIIRMHVARGRYDPGRIRDSMRISTLSDHSVLLQRFKNRKGLYLDGKPVLRVVEGANGVLYVLGHVIAPAPPDTAAADTALAAGAQPARPNR